MKQYLLSIFTFQFNIYLKIFNQNLKDPFSQKKLQRIYKNLKRLWKILLILFQFYILFKLIFFKSLYVSYEKE